MSHKKNLISSICILRLSSIGDITHMIPIIKTIQYYLPKSDITWIIGKTEYPLVKNMKGVNFILIDKSKNIRSIINLWHEIKSKKFDIFLHMQKSLRSKIIGFFIKYKRKLNYSNIQIPKNSHVLDSFFCFLKEIGIDKRVLDWSIEIDSSDKDIINIKKKYIVLNPFTSVRRFNYREWEIQNYATVAKYIFDKYNIETIVIGGPSQYEIKKSKQMVFQSYIHNIVGKTNLHQMCCIINNCQFYIGPDSGTMHIASMLNKPVIGLFATSNSKRTGPYHSQDYIIDKYDEALKIFLNKSENQISWGKRIRNKKAMSLITTDEVCSKIDELMKKNN